MNTEQQQTTRQELLNLSRQELVEMAGEFDPPVFIKDSWNKRTIVSKILQAQSKLGQQQPQADPQEPAFHQAGFAEAVNELNEQPAEPEPDGRGGPRAGAGRPTGTTEKEIALRLRTADENVREMVRLALSAINPTMEFSNDELDIVAVPYTKLYRYYVPESIRDSIWAAWAEAALGTIMLYRAINAKKSEKIQQPSGPDNLHGSYNLN
jgi:hypothetical protein